MECVGGVCGVCGMCVSGVCDVGGALVIAHFRGHLCVFYTTTGDSLHWGVVCVGFGCVQTGGVCVCEGCVWGWVCGVCVRCVCGVCGWW